MSFKQNMTSVNECHRDLKEGSKIVGLKLAISGKSSGCWLWPCLGHLRPKLCGATPVSGCIN